MKTQLFVKILVPLVFLVPLVISLKAKPLGGMRYRWGTWIGLVHGFFACAIDVAMTASGHGIAGSVGAVIAAAPFATVSVGLLRRKRYGVVAFYIVQSLFCPGGVISAMARNDAVGSGIAVVSSVAFLAASASYFGKRMKFMSASHNQGPNETQDNSEPVERVDEGPAAGLASRWPSVKCRTKPVNQPR